MSETLYSIVVIGGPILLVVAILYAALRNRQSPAQERRTEQATRDLYRDESKADDLREGDHR